MEGPASRLNLEVQWRLRLNVAEAQYKIAAMRFDQLVEEQRAMKLPEPDSSYAIHQAKKNQSLALAEYMRVLGIFSDLIVKGVAPAEW